MQKYGYNTVGQRDLHRQKRLGMTSLRRWDFNCAFKNGHPSVGNTLKEDFPGKLRQILRISTTHS